MHFRTVWTLAGCVHIWCLLEAKHSRHNDKESAFNVDVGEFSFAQTWCESTPGVRHTQCTRLSSEMVPTPCAGVYIESNHTSNFICFAMSCGFCDEETTTQFNEPYICDNENAKIFRCAFYLGRVNIKPLPLTIPRRGKYNDDDYVDDFDIGSDRATTTKMMLSTVSASTAPAISFHDNNNLWPIETSICCCRHASPLPLNRHTAYSRTYTTTPPLFRIPHNVLYKLRIIITII